jgi:hypothetical protein
MIKTLRITTIATAILAGVLLVFPVVFGVRADEEAEQFLNSPSVIEAFKQAQGDKQTDNESQSSPLVKQAEAFALYLNPRPEPRPTIPIRRGPVVPPTPPKASAKFTLVGTSVHQTCPEESLAFINEPGSGLRWVGPGSKLGHIIVEQIKDGLIIYKDEDGQETKEMSVQPRLPEISLLEGEASAWSAVSSTRIAPKLAPTASAINVRPGAPIAEPAMPETSDQESAALAGLVEKLRALQKSSTSDKAGSGRAPEESAAMMEKLISDFKSMRVDAQEAQKLDDLGKKLNGIQQDPNRAENNPPPRPAGSPRPIPRPPRTR